MFKSFWGSQEQQPQPHPQENSANSWYSSSFVGSSTNSLPTTPGPSTSSSLSMMRPTYRPNSSSNVSPSGAASIIATLKDKSVDELRKLLSDKDAYQNLLLSLEPVKTQNRVRDEFRNETLQLARENLEKEPRIVELRNQCRIIRTTELASAHEKLQELERKKDDTLKYYSPSSLLRCLQEAMDKTDEESETLHRQLLDREVDITAFVQKHKKMRYLYHKRALANLAMSTSVTS